MTNFDIKRPAPKKMSLPAKVLELPKKIVPDRKVRLQIISFITMSLLIVGVVQGAMYLSRARNASGEILGAATSAYADLNNASQNLSAQDLSSAQSLFDSALNNVHQAQNKLDEFKALTWIAPQANSADHILSGAGYLASAGEKLTQSLKIFDEIKVSSKGVETSEFEQKLLTNKQALAEALELVNQSKAEFDQVKSIPLDYEGTLNKAKEQIGQLSLVLNKLIGLENLYSGIFSGQKTYLLIFQNYDEQRATGGFIGTYGVLKTNQGKIFKMNISSIYDLDGQINELVAAPGPMQPDIKRWGIRDANWFADFPTSANKLLDFFEKGQQTADGVISFTPKVFEDILRLLGPIEMKEYGVTLTPENFQEVVQYKTSIDYDRKQNEPKKMLADFAPVLLDRLTTLPQDQWFEFLEIMQNNLNQRNLLIYSKDKDVEKSIDDLGFSGKLLSTDYDYLNIVNTNLGGTKTDLDMEQSVTLGSKILSDGSIINTLTITRSNPSPAKNRDFMRVLVPLNSEFIAAKDFDSLPLYPSTSDGLATDPDLAAWDQGTSLSNIFVRTETGKTEFSGWVNTEPGEEKTVTLSYMLPFKLGSTYSLLLQKQAGSKPYSFHGSFNPSGYSTSWFTDGVVKYGSILDYRSHTNTDDFWGIVLSK